MAICEPLQLEDYVVQPCTEVSPPKWHLGHTTWYFEEIFLKAFKPNFKQQNPFFSKIFNSYYQAICQPWEQSDRGKLSRPTVNEIFAYRKEIDKQVCDLLADSSTSLTESMQNNLILGLNHEQQHQELLFMDIKRILSQNLMNISYLNNIHAKNFALNNSDSKGNHEVGSSQFIEYEAGLFEFGTNSEIDFCYDNESPKHKVYVGDFSLQSRLVTNAEFLDFINDGGYQNFKWWLSDGWNRLQAENWLAPLYWRKENSTWQHYTLFGWQSLNLHEPIMHLSFFEAEAYARWAGCRLPTEFEWERVSQHHGAKNSQEGFLRNMEATPLVARKIGLLEQLYGVLWQWTSSAYAPYPGFKPFEGSAVEYNGKFMNSQMVLRGGAFISEKDHFRPTYRNFYYPWQRWQFSGLRLAKDT